MTPSENLNELVAATACAHTAFQPDRTLASDHTLVPLPLCPDIISSGRLGDRLVSSHTWINTVDILARVRRLGGGLARQYPLYRVFPSGRLHRDLERRHNDARHRHPGLPTEPLSGKRRWADAARSAFQAGHDETYRDLLDSRLAQRPDDGDALRRLAELALFRGDFTESLRLAGRCVSLDPGDAKSAALRIRLGYLLGHPDADAEALATVGRLPESTRALWAAAMHCNSGRQFRALKEAALASVPEDVDRLERLLPPLGTAAARSGLPAEALETYVQAIALRLSGANAGRPVTLRRLGDGDPTAALLDVHRMLQRHSIDATFVAGTALGLRRTGAPFPHDDDLDVGVDGDDWDAARIRQGFVDDPMFRLDPLHPLSKKIAATHRSGCRVDVFHFYREDDRVWHDGAFVRWWNTPFGSLDFSIADTTIRLPAPIDAYLTESYGAWRTPDPDFDAFVDAPNVQVTDRRYHDLYFVRRAYRQSSRGNYLGALSDLCRVREVVGSTPRGKTLLNSLLPPPSRGSSEVGGVAGQLDST